jgi:hypothetical protein
MTYVQIAGDSGTGGATLTALGNNSVIVDAAVPEIVNLVNINNQRIYNPTRFQLTTAEKYVYTIDQTLGVVAMTDPNGNTLTINTNGVIHSSGKSIVFTRDSSGRITKIIDPRYALKGLRRLKDSSADQLPASSLLSSLIAASAASPSTCFP